LHFLYPPFLILLKALASKIVIDSGFLIRNFFQLYPHDDVLVSEKEFSFLASPQEYLYKPPRPCRKARQSKVMER